MKFLTKERAPSGCMRRSTPPRAETSTTPCCGGKMTSRSILRYLQKIFACTRTKENSSPRSRRERHPPPADCGRGCLLLLFSLGLFLECAGGSPRRTCPSRRAPRCRTTSFSARCSAGGRWRSPSCPRGWGPGGGSGSPPPRWSSPRHLVGDLPGQTVLGGFFHVPFLLMISSHIMVLLPDLLRPPSPVPCGRAAASANPTGTGPAPPGSAGCPRRTWG